MQRRFSNWSLGVLLAALGWASPARAEVIYESAHLGPTGVSSGANVEAGQFLGASFRLDQTVEITAVGGHLTMHAGFEGQTLFAAIIQLSGPGEIPIGAPFDASEILASVVFDPGAPSSDVRVALSVTLCSGDYALIFGSGLFGATGVGGMPLNNVDLPTASYIFWNGNTATWFPDPFTGARFVVEGNAVVLDTDGDGVADTCDVCCNSPTGVAVDEEGRPVGDLDADCDSDLEDFVLFEAELTCGTEFHLRDVAIFQNNFTGELPDDGPCP